MFYLSPSELHYWEMASQFDLRIFWSRTGGKLTHPGRVGATSSRASFAIRCCQRNTAQCRSVFVGIVLKAQWCLSAEWFVWFVLKCFTRPDKNTPVLLLMVQKSYSCNNLSLVSNVHFTTFLFLVKRPKEGFLSHEGQEYVEYYTRSRCCLNPNGWCIGTPHHPAPLGRSR